jgi:mono/diheme cytochrome c family protein
MVLRAAVLILAFLTAPLAAEVRDLKAFFQQHCAPCHGSDGTGRGPNSGRLGGRNLADGRWLAKQDQDRLVASILKGQGAMPGFRRQLSEGEARRLLAGVIGPLAARKNH